MQYSYIIHSASIDKYYTGHTPNLVNRLDQHNTHYFSRGFTKSAEDWKIVLTKNCSNKQNAMYLERFIKRMKSRKFIQKVIVEPKIIDEILMKKK